MELVVLSNIWVKTKSSCWKKISCSWEGEIKRKIYKISLGCGMLQEKKLKGRWLF